MEITEVRVALCEATARAGAGEGRQASRRLKAYATVTFDHCFVVRNMKVIEGANGLFVAMPSHKTRVACGTCHWKNEFGGRFCAQCGAPLPRPVEGAGVAGGEGTDAQAHRDIAHPITMAFRQYLQQKVLEVYEAERAKGQHQPPPDRPAGEHDTT